VDASTIVDKEPCNKAKRVRFRAEYVYNVRCTEGQSSPMARKASKNTMYIPTTRPLVLAGAISVKYNGAVTVRPPAPNPAHMRLNKSSPYIPDANTWINVPVAQTMHASRHATRRPSRSLRSRTIRAPNAAPSTLKEEMFALRLASSVSSIPRCLVRL
jgi:hypothetical protein